MTYQETLDFLYGQLPAWHRIGKAAYKNDLQNTRLLDDHFDHPHRKYMTIHVAGTNGKGSVSHMIASVLQEAGWKTGLYTSPHLKDFRERIRINGEMISENAVVQFVIENKGIIESLKPSFFEMTVALAFSYFASEEVDIAVIEVGLGGRLDSTNIITPVLSVITNIGHDHMDLLGATIGKVAAEKAGIIKKQIPVVISESDKLTKEIFLSAVKECMSTVSFADEQFECLPDIYFNKEGERKFEIREKAKYLRYDGYTPLGGDYQAKNIQAVFSAFRMLKEKIDISDQMILRGIRKVVSNTGLMGRWQVLGQKPFIVCDTGHNREGLEYVLNQISRIEVSRRHIVVGFVNDKELGSVLPLFPRDAKYYFTKASVPRALNEEVLKTEAEKYGLTGSSYPDVRSAFVAAKENASESDLIFIGGSTFVVAEVI
jgi:dihydrofolate synthase / folylpolyglutamate synthase